MRNAERVSGILAGVFGLAALTLTLTQPTQQVYVGWTFYAPLSVSTGMWSRLAIYGPIMFAAAMSVLAGVGALLDTRATTRRGLWGLAVVVGGATGIAAEWLVGTSSLYIVIGAAPGSHGPGTSMASAGLVFLPAILAGLCAASLAVVRRARRAARA